MADHSIPDQIALEIMDTIEREKRINRDDLRMAVERVLQRADRWLPPVMVRPNDVTGWDWAPGGVEWVPALTDYERYVADQRKDMRQAKSKREMQAAYKRAEILRASLWGQAEPTENSPATVSAKGWGGFTPDFIAVDEAGAVDMTDNALLPRKDMSSLEVANRFGCREVGFRDGSVWTIEATGARETYNLKRVDKDGK